jgi:dissimilatory sulfite reductase (desulfoviridin) alpha/beta subunit
MDNKKDKRIYEKPMLKTIDLAAEEVMAIGCKLASGGSNVGNPAACTAPVVCVQAGS